MDPRFPRRTPPLITRVLAIAAIAAAAALLPALSAADITPPGKTRADPGSLLRDAEQLLRGGYTSKALTLLLPALSSSTRDEQRARILLSVGNAYFLLGDPERALVNTEQALELADELRRDDFSAAALNHLGNIAAIQGRKQEALAEYGQAIELAEPSGQVLLGAEASINAGRIALDLEQRERALEFATRAAQALKEQPADDRHAKAHLALGRLLTDLNDPRQGPLALRQFQRAVDIGRRLGDSTLLAYGFGYMGRQYERERRLQEAIAYTGKALYAALGMERMDILYRLQWQAGRLLRDLGQIDEAIATYRQAAATLQRLRSELASGTTQGPLSFAEFGKLYYQLADLLLRRAASHTDAARSDNDLLAARDTIERLKAVELEDYFQDECITGGGGRQVALDREVDPASAAVYPIVLPDRLELLVSFPRRMQRFTVAVDAATLNSEARALRNALETSAATEYLEHAQRLYDWLIRPLELVLKRHRVDTLVFVPDGALRLIPLSALHDGKRFLVERYAVASSPALVLTDPKPLQRDNPEVLLSGLSQSVQGYPPLPAVSEELATIHGLFGGKIIENADFVKPRIRSELEQSPYTIVHIATHGEIESDVRKSFLLTFDDQLTMDELERYVKRRQFNMQPVELLTLSACRTAVGDERAALGLAGIALKAGARSAVATLWAISDEATARLVPLFYANLADPGNSKAKALQRAQQELLAGERFAHPGYWAPFLLVGNWL